MPPENVTQMLLRWNAGDERARDEVMPLLYDELQEIAHARMQCENANHTLDTTGLVHEAYLKLVDITQVQWNDRGHFLALFSRMMRHILIDYARSKQAARRGGNRQRVDPEEQLIPNEQVDAVLELDDALQRLATEHERPALAIAHCYFGGLTNEEAAEVLGVSRATIERDLRFARAWIAQHLSIPPPAA